ncbi:ATP-binding cassette domain-containing protein [Catenuloplanes indicus]|uniref:Peptide/nickel transport system ATP-binding protein n=1 Tax=Catenuloplanes indicus TaxID=137267 RepID=A0AAE4AVL2_9ACTN|nr:ATP-binding cassette domain-containing protein [Catenuloplanes indicus]MDQ0364142.1 peptide/nickel transport system ATP-binding protein [Catenuloplanes indicus]
MGERVLAVAGLAVHRRGRALVPGVDLACAAGERVAIVGASGSGKSLTARAILGALPSGLHATGSLRIAGHEVLDTPAAVRLPVCRAAAVLQDSALALHPLIPVGAQIALPLRASRTTPETAGHGLRPAAETPVRRGRFTRSLAGMPVRGGHDVRALVAELLDAVGLPADTADRYPGELSGGQRQRVCLAVALAARPPLIVADEPTTALDVITQAAIVELLRDRTGGPGQPALLFITHDLAVAAALCTRVVVMHDGIVAEDGPLPTVLGAPRHPHTRELVRHARAATL